MSKDTYLCLCCNNEAPHSCKKCKSAHYCSHQCQEADWPIHKLLCSTYATLETSSGGRPSKDHKLAVLFPENEQKPKWIWLHCKREFDEDEGRWWTSAQSNPFLQPTPHGVWTFPLQRNMILERWHPNTLAIAARDGFLLDGSKVNKSVLTITSKRPGTCHDWRGPIVFYSRDGRELDPPHCRDFDMEDFKHAADYLQWYGYKPLPESSTARPTTEKTDRNDKDIPPVKDKIVMGVRINCEGDQKRFGKSKYEPIEVACTDPIFSQHDTPDLCRRVGIPIYTRPLYQDPAVRSDVSYSSSNQSATFMHLNCDETAKFDPNTGNFGWGWAPEKYQNDTGSVLVVRQDKKPLKPIHVEALAEYCQFEARPLFAYAVGEYGERDMLSKNDVLKLIRPATFLIWCYKFADKKRDSGQDADELLDMLQEG